MTALKLWQEYPGRALRWFQGAEVRVEAAPELMGVGYIIGPRIAGYLFAGGGLAYLVLMPAIKLFGAPMTTPMYPATKLVSEMSAGEIRAAFVFYIGAGAVATAGIVALVRSLPTIASAFQAGFADLKASRVGQAVTAKLRTDDDLPITVTVFGSLLLALVLAFLPSIGVNLLGGLLIIVFGFFFTTVSSRICGQIGSSANPISGMTIASLIAISLIFLLLGWTQIDDRVRAISIACVIAVAVANGGNTSQDLKTGFLVGATPRRQRARVPRARAQAARFPEGHPHGADHRRDSHAPLAVGPRADRRVPVHRPGARRHPSAPRGGRCLSPDHHVGGDVRGRRRALARGAAREVGESVARRNRVGAGRAVRERDDRRRRHCGHRRGRHRRRRQRARARGRR